MTSQGPEARFGIKLEQKLLVKICLLSAGSFLPGEEVKGARFYFLLLKVILKPQESRDV